MAEVWFRSGAGLSSLSQASKYADVSDGISTDLKRLDDLGPEDSSTARLEYCLSELSIFNRPRSLY